jgi:pimeloyl-ACP methyl ester carboxylesterase
LALMTPLVLIPGMMCDARMWGGLPAALHPRPVGHALPVGAETMSALARSVLDDAPPRFAIAGLSMGGIVAMEVLRQAPDRVDRLALLDTNALAEAPEVRARRAGQIARALAGDLDGVMRDEMKPNYLSDRSDLALLDLCMDMARSLGPEVFRRQSLALRDRPDQTATLAAFKGPALVLMGEHDRPCPRDRHDLMHRLMPQSRLVVIEGAGHLPTLERPEQTTAALRRWLED